MDQAPWTAGVQRWLREPLVHFLLLGAAVYGLYALTADSDEETAGNSIVVTGGEIEWLETSWQKRWNRKPTPNERAGLVRQYVRETVLYREALAMGLDRDDTIVRRRLAQKLEFLVDDLIPVPEPSPQQLLAYGEANRERYTQPALVTFTHVFIDPDRRGDETHARAEAVLAELQARGGAGERIEGVGDPFLLQSYYPERDEVELSKLFGGGFASRVVSLEPGRWHGPVLSAYGVHLVFVHARLEAEPFDFGQVRDEVSSDWKADERARLNDEYVARLIARYEIVVEETEGELALGPGAAR